jgi:hypothetical protein
MNYLIVSLENVEVNLMGVKRITNFKVIEIMDGKGPVSYTMRD